MSCQLDSSALSVRVAYSQQSIFASDNKRIARRRNVEAIDAVPEREGHGRRKRDWHVFQLESRARHRERCLTSKSALTRLSACQTDETFENHIDAVSTLYVDPLDAVVVILKDSYSAMDRRLSLKVATDLFTCTNDEHSFRSVPFQSYLPSSLQLLVSSSSDRKSRERRTFGSLTAFQDVLNHIRYCVLRRDTWNTQGL